MIKFEPPTKAASHSPFFIAVNAQSNAYMELLQAVSTKNDGPFIPKQYDTLFASIARLHLFLFKIMIYVFVIFSSKSAYPVIPNPPEEIFS